MKKKNIIIIDDDEFFSTMLKDFLEKDQNLNVIRFSSGEEFLSGIPEEVEAIILDQNLDNNSADSEKGIEILKKIKVISEDYKIIMLSDQESYGLAARTIMEGATEYVVKDKNAFERVKKLVS